MAYSPLNAAPPPQPQAAPGSPATARRPRRRSITWVLVFYIVLAVILALALVDIIGDRLIRASLLADQESLLAERASLQVEQIGAFRDEQIQALLQTARDPKFPAAGDPQGVRQYLEQMLPKTGHFDALALVDRQGKTLATTSQLLALDFASAAWFADARAGQTGISHLQMTASGSSLAFFFYTPLGAPSGPPQWIVVGLLPAAEIWKFVDPVKVSRSGYAYMADDNAVLIAHGSRDPTTGEPAHTLIFYAVGSLQAPAIQAANAASLYGEKKIAASAQVDSLAGFILSHPPPLSRHFASPAANVHRYYFPQQKADKTSVVVPIGTPTDPGVPLAVGPNDWVFGITVTDADFLGPLNRLRQALIVVSGLSILVAGLVGVLAAISVSRPLRQLADLARRVQAGETGARAAVQSTDEIGQLAAAMNAMLDRLAQAMQVQQEQVQALQHSGEEASQSALALSAAAEQMAAATEELNASAEQVAQAAQGMSHDAGIQMNHVQQTARQIHDLDQEIRRIAGLSDALLGASGQMRQMAAQAEGAIQETRNLTRRVQTVLHLIEKFGRQTNMLALNATIEAARAGEMGASFVVVAEEVRRLAESSEQALQEMDDLNKAIRQSIGATQSSVGQAGQSMLAVADMAAEMSAAAARQSRSSAGLVEVTNRLAGIAETNAAGAEEIASSIDQQASAFSQISSSSHELAVLAQKLQELSHQLAGSRRPEIERAP